MATRNSRTRAATKAEASTKPGGAVARPTKSAKKQAEAEVSFLGLYLSQPQYLSCAELAKVLVPWLIGLLVYGAFVVILFSYIAHTAGVGILWRDWYPLVTGSILAASGATAGVVAWRRARRVR